MAFQLLRGGALEELRPTGTTDLRCGSVERFLVFKGSASYRMELDGRVIERGKPVIPGLALKRPGLVASRGATNVSKLEEALLVSPYLADLVHGTDLLERSPNEKIGKIDRWTLTKENEDSKRSMPGVGPASAAFAPE